MAYTSRRRQTTEQRIESARERLEYLRGRLVEVEALEDLREGYRVTIKGVDEPLRAWKREMLEAVQERINDTEREIRDLERVRRTEQGLPVEPHEPGIITLTTPEEQDARIAAARRKRLLAGA